MKPAMNIRTLQVALVVIGATFVAIGEAPGIESVIPPLWVHLMQILGATLGGSQLLKRIGDYAPDEVTLVPAERDSRPQ